jgi:hypothetical protein
MSIEKKAFEELLTLSEDKKIEAYDFIQFLKQKQLKQDNELMEKIMDENDTIFRELAK